MPFTPKTWADGQAGGTPITADELNRVEQGVAEAHTQLDGKANAAALADKADASALAALVARVDALEAAAE